MSERRDDIEGSIRNMFSWSDSGETWFSFRSFISSHDLADTTIIPALKRGGEKIKKDNGL